MIVLAYLVAKNRHLSHDHSSGARVDFTPARVENYRFSSLLRKVLRGRSSNLAAVLMFPLAWRRAR